MSRSEDAERELPSNKAEASLRELARRIRTLRERKELKQEEFAQASGISVSFASLLERGERSPSYETLVQIADALGVSLAELFRDVAPLPSEDALYQRLADFGRGRRLTRTQVDRYLAVGAAMFDPRDESGAVRREGICGEPDCHRPVLARGLCALHYHRQRRARGE